MRSVVASVDDGSALDVRVADLMDKYDIPTIFYIPVNWQKVNLRSGREPLSPGALSDIANRFDIGSHTVNHPHLTKIPLEDARAEIVDSKSALEEMLARQIDSFCYPRGYLNPQIEELVIEAGYTDARTTKVGNLNPLHADPFQMATTVHVGCNRDEYGDLNWYEYAILKLDESKDMENSEYHLWLHSWELTKNNAWDDFERLLKQL